MLLESYNGLLSQAKSLNDLNRLNIAFENTLTPQEATELLEQLYAPGYVVPPARADRAFSDEEQKTTTRDWIVGIVENLKLVGKPDAESFLRRDLIKSVTLYTDGAPRAGKSLVIALPGANHRLMMPIAMLLQAFPAESVDVVMIRDGTRSAYRLGLEGLGTTIEEFGDGLPGLLNFADYKQVSGLGVSSGGLPILQTSLRLGLKAVLACGASSPFDVRWGQYPGKGPAETLREFAARGFETKVTIAYGADSAPDCQSAVDIESCLGVETLMIKREDKPVTHNILHPMAQEGKLPAFLAEHLGL